MADPISINYLVSSLNNQNLIQYEKRVCTLGYGKKKKYSRIFEMSLCCIITT